MYPSNFIFNFNFISISIFSSSPLNKEEDPINNESAK